MKKALIIILVLIVVGVGVYFFFKDDLSGVDITDLCIQAETELERVGNEALWKAGIKASPPAPPKVSPEEAERIRKLNMDGLFEGWESMDPEDPTWFHKTPYLYIDKLKEREPDERRKATTIINVGGGYSNDDVDYGFIMEPLNLDIYGINPDQKSILDGVDSLEFHCNGYSVYEDSLDRYRRAGSWTFGGVEVETYQYRSLNTNNPECRHFGGCEPSTEYRSIKDNPDYQDKLYAVGKWDKSKDRIILYEYLTVDPSIPKEVIYNDPEGYQRVYVIYNIILDPDKTDSWTDFSDEYY